MRGHRQRGLQGAGRGSQDQQVSYQHKFPMYAPLPPRPHIAADLLPYRYVDDRAVYADDRAVCMQGARGSTARAARRWLSVLRSTKLSQV
eukprot:4815505-Pleurochrysis_carterae.AAC.3